MIKIESIYVSPEVIVNDIECEGVLCASSGYTEEIFFEDGEW